MWLPDLDDVPGTVSVWCAEVGAAGPVHARAEHVPHYAASTMKIAVLAAAQHLDPDRPVPVTDRFRSAVPGATFVLRKAKDDDPAVWARLGGTAPLGWLAERMIVSSSNLATNLVLGQVGLAGADAVWRLVGARDSRIGRGIEDAPARAAGITNEVTAYDLGRLLEAIALGRLAGAERMLAILSATAHRDDIAAGLPAGVRLAHKSGWVTGVRHGAGLVCPAGRSPYTLVVCSTTSLPDVAARALLARIAAGSWAELGSAGQLGRAGLDVDRSPHGHGQDPGAG
jgi:beta-lactamase class A